MLPASFSSYLCYQAFSLHCSFFDASKLLACPKAKELAEGSYFSLCLLSRFWSTYLFLNQLPSAHTCHLFSIFLVS